MSNPSNDTTYNGRTNYETWLVALRLDNDESTQIDCNAMAKDALALKATDIFTADQHALYTLQDSIEEYVREMVGKHRGFVADLINASLSKVNYREIAANYLETAKENA